MNLDDLDLSQVVQELSTVRDYLRWGLSRFNSHSLHYGHGTDNAWDEIVQLTLDLLHLPHDVDLNLLDATLTVVERRILSDAIQRRIKERTPVPYLTHLAWFAGHPFYVDERVIIPRSPIGELIQNEFSPWLDPEKVTNILDLCTGNGCIAIASALALPNSKVDAIDISNEALEVATINIKKYEVEDRVNLIQSDLYAKLPKNSQYDLIISNPPYVSTSEYESLPKEYRHEPQIAFKGGNKGLDLVTKILKGAGNHLSANGLLIVEVGNYQEALMQRFPEIPFLWLEFSRGGEGVFLLTAEQLKEYESYLK